MLVEYAFNDRSAGILCCLNIFLYEYIWYFGLIALVMIAALEYYVGRICFCMNISGILNSSAGILFWIDRVFNDRSAGILCCLNMLLYEYIWYFE